MTGGGARAEAGFCGDYCGKCPNHGSSCDGCTAEGRGDCRFVRCCTGKGLEHCGLCPEMPCGPLQAFVPDDSEGNPRGYHIENLRERTRVGTARWLAAQRERWSALRGTRLH